MIAHDICYPSSDTFCQLRIVQELDANADSYFMVGTDDHVIAEVWVFADKSVAVSCPNQIVKAYPSIKFVSFN